MKPEKPDVLMIGLHDAFKQTYQKVVIAVDDQLEQNISIPDIENMWKVLSSKFVYSSPAAVKIFLENLHYYLVVENAVRQGILTKEEVQ